VLFLLKSGWIFNFHHFPVFSFGVLHQFRLRARWDLPRSQIRRAKCEGTLL